MANTPALLFPTPAGGKNALNITTTTVVKTSGGTVRMVAVNTAGTAVGGVYDTATAGGVAAATLAFAIPETVTAGPQSWQFRCETGITVVPPTGGVVSLSFD